MATASPIDTDELLRQVKDLYRAVARSPEHDFHFETGRGLAQRLGYVPADLDTVPAGACDSFAGVGYFFDLADLQLGERVLDLGSGSGMDAFVAARHVGAQGRVVGIDMTDEQLVKAEDLRAAHGFEQVRFEAGRIEWLPFADSMFDAVISNGVINLTPDKAGVFAEASRVLRPGGRLAIADIVTDRQLSEAIVCNVDLWASCIGGAPRQDTYLRAIADAGLRVEATTDNPYAFLSEQARDASATYGVKSISVLAHKPGTWAGTDDA